MKRRLAINNSNIGDQIKNIRKFWFVHGTKDEIIPVDQVDLFGESVGDPNRCIVYKLKDAVHSMRSPHGKKGFEPLVEWLNSCVYPEILTGGA